MEESLYQVLCYIMPILAIVVFIALFYIQAGYGIFQNKHWGISIPNQWGWVLMECPAFFFMLYLWISSPSRLQPTLLTFFILFEAHYLQRSFIFPLLMRGKSRMPIAIMLMGILFNLINGFMIGEDLFHWASAERYSTSWMSSPTFIGGLLLFISGMGINLHSDHVIRHLRKPGDTRHYLPQKGMYRFITSANYFGELIEWIGFAILTQSTAAWIFVLWTFANLAPRAYSIHKHYCEEFGKEAVGQRKCLIPFIY